MAETKEVAAYTVDELCIECNDSDIYEWAKKHGKLDSLLEDWAEELNELFSCYYDGIYNCLTTAAKNLGYEED